MKRFSLSTDGQPLQYLPSTDVYLPTALAIFDSIGQKPVPVKVFCWVPRLVFPMHGD